MTAIFLHSSYRTSSTWIWSKFRAIPSTMAFYEPFNWILTQDKAKILAHSATNWNSGHELAGEYFTEYAPLICGGKGVPGLLTTFRFEKYIPLDGLGGALDPAIPDYLGQLIRLAQSEGKVPVFSHKSTLGRIASLRRVFGGLHVFVYKNLWDQWVSYVSQYENANNHFVNSVWRIISTNQHVELFKELTNLYGSSIEKGGFGDFADINKACCAFLALHIFLYMNAIESADLSINVNRLAWDKNYKDHINSRIEFLSRLKIDLEGANRNVGWYCDVISLEELEQVKSVVLSHAKDWAKAETVAFAISILDEFHVDSRHAEVFSKSIFEKYREMENKKLRWHV